MDDKNSLLRPRTIREFALWVRGKPIRQVVALLFIVGMGQLWQDEWGLQLANQVDCQTRNASGYD